MSLVAIPFIQHDGAGLRVCEEGARLLQGIQGKLAVVAVAGPYRTGKSFLLNNLITGAASTKAEGFKVGGTVNACTKGIWLWGHPLNKGGVTYVFLDTEGLGSLDQNATFDTQTFSLALLLSSLFLLNTQGTISESALEQLELVVECSKQIRVRDAAPTQQQQQQLGGDLAAHFPAFLWVLRDFVLQLVDDNGSTITPREYLEKALRPQVSGRHLEQKNRIRQVLSTVFPRRDCETLVRPVLDERELQQLNTTPVDRLRKEFREGMERLREKVFQTATPKTVDGHFINGASLVLLAQAYAKAMNEGAVPTIQSAWQSVVTIQAQQAAEAATKHFHAEMQKLHNIMEVEELQAFYEATESSALQLFVSKSVGEEDFKNQIIAKLKAEFKESLQRFLRENDLRSKGECKILIEGLWSQLGCDGKVFQSSQEFEAARQELLKRYHAAAKGPAKVLVANSFFEKVTANVVKGLFEGLATAKKTAEALEKKVAELEGASAKQREAALKLEKDVEYLTKEKEKASQDLVKANEELKQGREKLSYVTRDLSNLTERLAISEGDGTALKKQISQLTLELQQSQQREREQERNLQATRERSEALNGQLRSSSEKSSKELGTMEERIKALTAEISMLREQASTTQQLLKAAEGRAEELSRRAAEQQEAAKQSLGTQLQQLQMQHAEQVAQLVSQREQDALRFQQELGQLNAEKSGLQQQIVSLIASQGELERKLASESGRSLKRMRLDRDVDMPEAGSGSNTRPVPAEITTAPAADDSSDEEYDMVSHNSPAISKVLPKEQPTGRKDPEKCTINELKSWLTSLDVELPPLAQRKQFYLDLLYEKEPSLRGQKAAAEPNKKKK